MTSNIYEKIVPQDDGDSNDHPYGSMDICAIHPESHLAYVQLITEKERFMIELSVGEVQAVSGGNVYYDIGYTLGGWYGNAVDYMSETVFPFYFG